MNRVLIIFILATLVISCKTTHNIQVNGDHAPLSKTLRKENASQLLAKLKSRKLNFKWLSAHFSMDMEVDSNETSFGE
jgi:hypothetical protein